MKFLIIILFIFQLPVLAQNITLVNEFELPTNPVAISVDPFGSVYTIFVNGNIIKTDTSGKQLATHMRKTNSSDWQIDASNPYKIIIFNRDLQIVDIYNSDFGKINTIDLSLLDIGDIALCCISYNNSFWILSSSNNELYHFSENLEIISKTNLSLMNVEIDNYSNCVLKESGSKLLLAEAKKQAYIFDIYGNFSNKFSKNSDVWEMDKDIIYYVQNDTLQAYHMRLHEEIVLPINVKNINKFIINGNWISILSKNKISLFKK